MAWYSTGSVTVTAGSATVTGAATDFTTNARVGDGFRATGDSGVYQIAAIPSATQLTLSRVWDGSGGSGRAYEILPFASAEVALTAARLAELVSRYAGTADRAERGAVPVSSWAALTALPKAGLRNEELRFARGSVAAGDLGGGLFVWVEGATDTLVAGHVLAADEGGSGRWVRVKDDDVLLARHFGARSYPATTASASITVSSSAALAAAVLLGGAAGWQLRLPSGIIGIDDHDADSAGLLVQRACSIVGAGMGSTFLFPMTGFGAAKDVLVLRPASGTPHFGYRFEGFTIGHPGEATRRGRHGLRIETTVSGAGDISHSAFRDIRVINSADSTSQTLPGLGTASRKGWGFAHENDAALNPNGGLFKARFDNCIMGGGWAFNRSGDTIVLDSCHASGPNIGCYLNLVSAAFGAANAFKADSPNFTNDEGALYIASANWWTIDNPNFENYTAGLGTADAIVRILGNVNRVKGGLIRGGFISHRTGSGSLRLVTIDAADFVRIEESVTLQKASASVVDVVVTANAKSPFVGDYARSSSVFANQVSDAGEGLRGAIKEVATANGWNRAIDSVATLRVQRLAGGWVEFLDDVKSGSGVIATLPLGFRPVETRQFETTAYNGSTYVHAIVEVGTGGTVSLVTGSNARLFLMGKRFKINGELVP